MLKPLASAIHNYSDLSYITKKGVKEKCLCGFKIIQLLRKWSLVLMKQCGNLDLRRKRERSINTFITEDGKLLFFQLFFFSPRGVNNLLIWVKYGFHGWCPGESNKGKAFRNGWRQLALLHLSHVIGCISHARVRARQGEWGRLRGHLFLFPSFQTRSFRI